ncbi:MAG: energy-coupling factor transporter transmembrane protein EcfT [Chloroflexi bacterium]|nr:energy-coupling factor transporter transmembrane protein EcfT [Chloroflexota bacterium]
MPYHTLTWLSWLGAAAYLALVNQQLLQSILLIFATGTVFVAASRNSRSGTNLEAGASYTGRSWKAEGWSAFLRFGLSVWLIALFFNLLFAHAGNIVLFALPHNWPFIGGPITLEALLYGLANGASLFAVLLVFATFNLGMDAHRLLRWLPAGLYQAGLIVSIALAFVPQLITSLKEIREAQLLRGHRFRAMRDWIPLFVPLLTTALERSLTLAESMESRGFGGTERFTVADSNALPVSTTAAAATTNLQRGATLAGLLALLVGLLWQATDSVRWPGLLCAALGILLISASLYIQGRRLKRTHYHHELWQQRDTLVTAACLVSISITAYIQARDPAALFYYPYPPYSPWPKFSPLLGLAILLIATPAWLWPSPARILPMEAIKDED